MYYVDEILINFIMFKRGIDDNRCISQIADFRVFFIESELELQPVMQTSVMINLGLWTSLIG